MTDKGFASALFSRASRYHPDWIAASVSGGANSLWITERLAGAMDLRPGMRGTRYRVRAGGLVDLPASRIHAAGVGCRPRFDVTENMRRVKDAGIEGRVTALHV